MAGQNVGETAARELTRRYAERAMRAVVELAKSAKSPRVRVSAAKTVLRGDTSLAEKKIAVDALVEVMDTAKSESTRLSAAKEILRGAHAPPAKAAAAADAGDRPSLPLPAALATLLSRPQTGPKPKAWQHGTALSSGTVRLPR